jgi:cell division septation protein DedD
MQQEIEQEVPDMYPVSQPAIHDRKEYYIVAGCFREESNADQLVIELRKKGYQAEKFGKIGNLYAVSFSSFADKSAALEELKKIRDTEQKGAWIAYY